MILLNEDEIDAIDCTYERCGTTKHNTDAHKLAKAQLKKVDKVVDDYFKKNAWMTRDGWKAILKEEK